MDQQAADRYFVVVLILLFGRNAAACNDVSAPCCYPADLTKRRQACTRPAIILIANPSKLAACPSAAWTTTFSCQAARDDSSPACVPCPRYFCRRLFQYGSANTHHCCSAQRECLVLGPAAHCLDGFDLVFAVLVDRPTAHRPLAVKHLARTNRYTHPDCSRWFPRSRHREAATRETLGFDTHNPTLEASGKAEGHDSWP